MNRKGIATTAGCGAVVLAAAMWSANARAQDAVGTTSPTVVEQTTSSPPNVPLIASGLVLFGGTYAASGIVAAANNNSYDNHLFIPVAGPWLDLANRPDCGGFGQTSCGAEGVFKALLIADGAAQGLGALATVLGFVVPETRTTVVAAKNDKPRVKLVPARLSRDGYGLAAYGKF